MNDQEDRAPSEAHKLSDEQRGDSEDAVAITAVAGELRETAPDLRGVSNHQEQAEYLALAVKMDGIVDTLKAIAENLRVRALTKGPTL